MKIQNMFQKDIERDINGVIKVMQDDDRSLEQELSEYIITKELRRHFRTFFDNYTKAIDQPTDKIGVWISGFFGSGKSHFLKILSYLLSNQEVCGKRAIDYFADKFDDPMMYAQAVKSVSVPTQSILFNIDIEGPLTKDKTAVLRVFAKMFYNHCGFYGDDLKIAKLERFIEKQGKTHQFREAFEKVNGAPWTETRDSFAFFEDDIVSVLQSTLGMSEQAARNWFNGEETNELSIAQLVADIQEYVDGKGKDFRLLFMVDEVGQYIGDDGDLMINLQERARSYIEKAIVGAKVIVHGEVMDIKTGNAKDKLDTAMNGLVESVYSKLNMVNRFVESDADLLSILNGTDDEQIAFTGQGANNEDALNEISQWLELQNQKMLSTSMGDVQRRYQAIPYGWREIDIAALIARLISQQKISIKYGGALVGKDERRLVDYLRKKSEIDKAVVTRRIAPSEDLMRKSIAFLRDYLGAMDIPSDEDGLIRFVLDTFTQKQEHYQELLDNAYSEFRYPEKEVVTKARDLMNDVLSQRRDNVALLTRMVQRQEDLLDCSEDMEGVEFFFKSQRSVYDEARRQMDRVNKERDYFASDADVLDVFHTIATILAQPKPYDRIGELPELIQKVKAAYSGLLDLKKDEVAENIRQCMQDVHQLATEARDAGVLLRQADDYFVGKREAAKNASSLTELDAMITQLLTYKDNICRRMEVMSASHQERTTPVGTGTAQPAPKMPKITTLRRYDLCSVKRLQSKEDIDRYVDGIREKLMKTLEGCDGVQIN